MTKLIAFLCCTFLLIEFNSYSQTSIDYFRQGMHKSDLQDYRGAIQDYNNAIDFDYLDAYINRAGAKHKLYDYRGAIQDCNKAIELKPDFSMAYINLSLLNLF